MKRTTRLLLTIPVVSFAFACQDHDPVGVPTDVPLLPASAVYQVPGHMFLPPIGTASSAEGFLGTLSPNVVVCQLEHPEPVAPSPVPEFDCKDGMLLAEFSMTSGTGGDVITLAGDNSYHVNWKTSSTIDPLMEGATYQIVVLLGDEVLGSVDIAIFANMGQARKKSGDYFPLTDGSNLPIKFGIELRALLEVLDLPELAGSTDFVVETFSTEERVQTASVPSGNAGFRVDGANVNIPGGGTQFTLLIAEQPLTNGECVASYGGPNAGGCYIFETIPRGVTFEVDEEPAGEVQVCPDPGVTDEYDLAKWDDGVTTFPPQPDNLVNVTPCDETALDRLPGVLRGLARLLLPRPLYAKDEGEMGMVRGFSTIFWAVPLAVEQVTPLPEGPFTPGQVLPLSFRALQTHHHDEDGGEHEHPQDGAEIEFGVTGGGPLTGRAVTLNDGVASLNFSLPTVPGQYSLTAQIADYPGSAVSFALDVVEAPAYPTGLLLRYEFEGNANNTGLLGSFDGGAESVTFPQGRFGQAIKFDGTISSRLVVPGSRTVFENGGSKWTISLWFREDVLKPNSVLWEFRGPAQGWQTYHGVVEPGQRMITCSDGGCLSFFSDAEVWHNIVYRYDGESGSVGAPIDIYVDGVLEGQIQNLSSIPLIGSAVNDIRMGNGSVGASVFYIDEFRVFNQVFSEEEQCETVSSGFWNGEGCDLDPPS